MHTRSLTQWQHDHLFDQHLRQPGEQRVLWVIALTGATMVIEVAAGLTFGSMALLADGLHMGSHLVALATAWLAYGYARRHADDRRFSFGTGKVNALAGYSSAIALLLVALAMGVESGRRLANPPEIAFGEALAVAVLGLLVNGISAWLLADHDHDSGHAHHHDHNLRAAYLHVLADMATSVLAIAALLAGLLMGWSWLDAIAGIVGALVISRWAFGLMGDTGNVLLDRHSNDATLQQVRNAIELENDRVSDLHVWSIGNGYAAAITVVTDAPLPPTHYKSRIPASAQIIHATVEVHRCEGHED
ncbi:MAG: CDF family Co(II)/Ni(II) efflux transporter DmeF [Rhodospirillales bacterium]